jgi:DNA-binding transcriptional regulator YdaS (Cro superfamily)
MNMSALERAIEIVGGQAALARRIGGKIRQQHVWYWLKHSVPAKYCGDIERATYGQVTRHDLRPDVFDEPPRRQRRKRAEVSA